MLPVQQIDESQAGDAPQENFTGRVRMQKLAEQGGMTKVELLAVFFDAGAHTRPHTHPSEQMLYFVQGSGFVQFPGEERQRVEEGGVVVIPAGVVHMHGATEDEAICHVALRAADGPTNWHPDGVPEEWRGLLASDGHG
jgi:quercetin dioxygenase-like cupin family protein